MTAPPQAQDYDDDYGDEIGAGIFGGDDDYWFILVYEKLSHIL